MNDVTNSPTASPTAAARLQHFPIAWFAMIMGLCGLAMAWHQAEQMMGLKVEISVGILILSTVLFIVLVALYGLKMLHYWDAVVQEWAHPVKMNFVPTVSIAMILLSIGWLPYSAPYSKLLWLVGTVLHLMLTLHVMTQWMHHSKFEIVHLNPAWFIPVVGNILVPIAGINHAPAEISWFFFSIGLLFWPVLLTIIFYRVIFHGSLPQRLMPTLFILIAPPAVGFLSYVKLTGGLDMLALLFYYSALFFVLLLTAQLTWFARLKFFLSWWAYSFPLAAITVATFAMYEHTGNLLFARLASILLGVATVVIAGLFVRTTLGVVRKEICVED